MCSMQGHLIKKADCPRRVRSCDLKGAGLSRCECERVFCVVQYATSTTIEESGTAAAAIQSFVLGRRQLQLAVIGDIQPDAACGIFLIVLDRYNEQSFVQKGTTRASLKICRHTA